MALNGALWSITPSRRITGVRSQRWFPTALTLATLALVYGSWQLTRWGLPEHRKLIADLFCYPFDVAVVWTTWRASQRTANVPQLRRAWRLLSLGAFSYLLGDVTYQVYDLMGIAPYPSVADGFYLAFDPLVLAGLLSFPVQRRGRAGNLRLWMEMSVVALAFSVAVGYFLLGPTIEAGGNVLQMGFSIAYPVGDMVLLVGLSAALLRGTAPSARRSLHFFAVGLACYVTSDVIYGYMTLHGGYTRLVVSHGRSLSDRGRQLLFHPPTHRPRDLELKLPTDFGPDRPERASQVERRFDCRPCMRRVEAVSRLSEVLDADTGVVIEPEGLERATSGKLGGLLAAERPAISRGW